MTSVVLLKRAPLVFRMDKHISGRAMWFYSTKNLFYIYLQSTVLMNLFKNVRSAIVQKEYISIFWISWFQIGCSMRAVYTQRAADEWELNMTSFSTYFVLSFFNHNFGPKPFTVQCVRSKVMSMNYSGLFGKSYCERACVYALQD